MSEKPARVDMRVHNKEVIERYRNEGIYEDGGMSLVVLTTMGRVSGEPRITPIAVQPDGDRLVVVGSMGGLPKNPQWYENLNAQPHITVEYRGDKYPAIARTVEPGPERDRLFDLMAQQVTGLTRYQERAAEHRIIPIVVIERELEA